MLRLIFSVVTAFVIVSGGGVDASPSELNRGDSSVVIGSGAVSGAVDGVFENVARNRMSGLADPSLPPDTELGLYDGLIATESCDYVGWNGYIVVTDGEDVAVRSVIVVDCQAERHKVNGGSLTNLGILADLNESSSDIWTWRGYLILSRRR